MPPLSVTYRGERFTVVPRPGLAIAGSLPWCTRVAGAWYQLTTDPAIALDALTRFVRDRLRSNWTRRAPSLLAARTTPVLLRVDRAVVRAWPAFVPRNRGATTYVNPATGDRVATTRGPLWIFEAHGRSFSPCGSASSEQTIADVVDLAKLWLRTESGS